MFRRYYNRKTKLDTRFSVSEKVKIAPRESLISFRKNRSVRHLLTTNNMKNSPHHSRSNSVIRRFSHSRSRSSMFPKTHHKNSYISDEKKRSRIPSEYHINGEIYNLASKFTKSRGLSALPKLEIPVTNGSSQWPIDIPIFVISINDKRRQNFQNRFPYPSTHFAGTNGNTIDVSHWRHTRRLQSNILKRGEIGCYDSHLRLWQMLVKNNVQIALICEDDVDLKGNTIQSQYFNTLLIEAAQTPFDVLYLSWFRPDGGRQNTVHTRVQWCFCQHWAYVVTLNGLKKLLADEKITNIRLPVDVALWEAHCRGVVRNVVAYPPLTLTVGERSDTSNLQLR